MIEAEFAFRVGADVEPVDGGHTHATIAEHIDAVMPGIEIVDHRFESWAVGALVTPVATSVTSVATDVFEAGAGDSCVADFGPLGTVTVAFV